MHAYQPDRLAATKAAPNPITGFVRENRALCGAALASTFVMGLIFTNAIFFQDGAHPSPLFSTRAIERVAPLDEPVKTAVLKAQPKKVPQSVSTPADTSETGKELLREVQTALSVRGYYAGKLDGLYGSRTRRAITAFQSDNGMPVDGKVTVRLLTQVLMSGSAQPETVPVPPKSQLASKPVRVKTVKVATSRVKPKIVSSGAPVTQADGLVARIQAGLRNYGYDDLQVDGKMGQQTATAIQRFQLDYGMKITGEASQSVLNKLSEIGAYTQG
ncbi:MAG: peptidoglycan-binding domain-containing protein [Pseudomonadota bacterium]